MKECLVHHDVHFPAYEQAAEIAQPREGAFDMSTTMLSSRHSL
jgi:hypothetical protein